ncbi:hypothetical protein D3C86_1908290 [compost metagenome]
MVDADRPEDLALGLVDEGIAGAHDLVDGRHAFGAIGHGGDGLGPANAEDAVSAGEVTAGDHGLVRIGRQAGDDLVDAGDLGRDNGHYRSR